jgi:hypothetical protein
VSESGVHEKKGWVAKPQEVFFHDINNLQGEGEADIVKLGDCSLIDTFIHKRIKVRLLRFCLIDLTWTWLKIEQVCLFYISVK